MFDPVSLEAQLLAGHTDEVLATLLALDPTTLPPDLQAAHADLLLLAGHYGPPSASAPRLDSEDPALYGRGNCPAPTAQLDPQPASPPAFPQPASPPPDPPPDPQPASPQPESAPPDPTPADLTRFLHLFAGREDVHARQWYDARRGVQGYSPQRQALSPALVQAHVMGIITLGVYPVRVDQTVTFLALDLDIRKAALEKAEGHRERIAILRQTVHDAAMQLLAVARSVGLSLLLEDSGYKGRHLWGFLAQPVEAGLAARLCRLLVRATGVLPASLQIDTFPRQDAVPPGGYGNLIKLPLGIHMRSGRRARLLGPSGPLADPWAALRDIERITRRQLLDAMDRLQPPPPGRGEARTGGVPTRPASPPAPFHPTSEALPEAASPFPEGEAPPFEDTPAAKPSKAAPPPMTLAEALAHPTLSAVVDGCCVLASLVEDAIVTRTLTHDERVVLTHAMGHQDEGTGWVNAVLGFCPDTPAHDMLQRALRGHPISCPRIRQRLGERTRALPCHCTFPTMAEYPTPSLHARYPGAVFHDRPPDGIPASERLLALLDQAQRPGSPDPARRALAAGGGEGMVSEEPARDAALPPEAPSPAALTQALRMLPVPVVHDEHGTWELVHREGRTHLVFTRRQGGEP